MISSRSVCRTDHQKSEHFRKIGASGSPDIANIDLHIANIDVHIAYIDVHIANIDVHIANNDVHIANIDCAYC